MNYSRRLKQLQDMEKEVQESKVKLLADHVLGEKLVGRPRKVPVVEDILDEPSQPPVQLVRPKPKVPVKRKVSPVKMKAKRKKIQNEKPVKTCRFINPNFSNGPLLDLSRFW